MYGLLCYDVINYGYYLFRGEVGSYGIGSCGVKFDGIVNVVVILGMEVGLILFLLLDLVINENCGIWCFIGR